MKVKMLKYLVGLLARDRLILEHSFRIATVDDRIAECHIDCLTAVGIGHVIDSPCTADFEVFRYI